MPEDINANEENKWRGPCVVTFHKKPCPGQRMNWQHWSGLVRVADLDKVEKVLALLAEGLDIYECGRCSWIGNEKTCEWDTPLPEYPDEGSDPLCPICTKDGLAHLHGAYVDCIGHDEAAAPALSHLRRLTGKEK